MRYLAVTLISLLSLTSCCCHIPVQPESIGGNFEVAAEATLIIKTEMYIGTDKVREFRGTGFLVRGKSGRVIVTVNHITGEEFIDSVDLITTAARCTKSSPWEEVKVLTKDNSVDIAIMTPINQRGCKIATLTDRLPRLGELVAAIGHPSTSYRLILTGRIAGRCGRNLACEPVKQYLIDRPAYPGISGGLVAGINGEVLGMVVSTGFLEYRKNLDIGPVEVISYDLDPAITTFVPSREIIRLLSE